MTHLTSDQLIDAMEGALAAERQAHLATCEQCRHELAGLSSVLNEAKQASVPEPSPLFWPHFSERVRVALDRETASGVTWPAWLRWQILVPFGAMATIIMALMIPVLREQRNDEASLTALQAPQAPEAPEALDHWVMLTELVGDIDIETASAAGVIEPGSAERAVLQLTSEEQQELTRLLKAELMRAKS
jgi:hypothetical protein